MTTRSKKKSQAQATISPSAKTRVENSWILLAKDSLLENISFRIITLPHPAHGKPTKYCLDAVNSKIYELVTFSEAHRSWFIGETVKSDGSIQIVTPINPLFLVLSKLKEQCNSRAIPLEDLLSEKGFNEILDFIPNLDAIGDMKGPPDMKAYKYNNDKAHNWLEERVRKLAKVLRKKNIHVTSGAVSATFVTSSVDNENVDEEFYLKYANGMISEYIPEELVTSLEKRFNFKPDLVESIGKKRKSELENIDNSKRIKKESSAVETTDKGNVFTSPDKNDKDVKKEKALTAKEKARQKAASGTKTISSFFTKK